MQNAALLLGAWPYKSSVPESAMALSSLLESDQSFVPAPVGLTVNMCASMHEAHMTFADNVDIVFIRCRRQQASQATLVNAGIAYICHPACMSDAGAQISFGTFNKCVGGCML